MQIELQDGGEGRTTVALAAAIKSLEAAPNLSRASNEGVISG